MLLKDLKAYVTTDNDPLIFNDKYIAQCPFCLNPLKEGDIDQSKRDELQAYCTKDGHIGENMILLRHLEGITV